MDVPDDATRDLLVNEGQPQPPEPAHEDATEQHEDEEEEQSSSDEADERERAGVFATGAGAKRKSIHINSLHVRWAESNLTPFTKQAVIVGEENPRALRSFLSNFLKDDMGTFRKHLDLAKHAKESGLPVTDATLQEIADLHPCVESIQAAACNEITDVGLWALARSCETLLEINLENCHKITHVGLRSLALRCHALKRIVLNRCHHVNDLSIRVVAAGCSSLRHVSLEGCTQVSDGSLSELARCCKSLRTLKLKNCAKLCEFGDKALVEIGQSCSKLREIDLSGCEHVRDAGVRALAHGCPGLKVFRASGCGQLTGASLRALARGCPALESLGLGECSSLGNKDTWILAESFPKLTSLSLRGVVRLKAEGIRGLCDMGDRLEVLNLSGCVQLDDECLTLMGNTMVKLHRLDLSGVPDITRRGVRDLCHGCLRLVNVELVGCLRLTRRILKEICSSLPFVKPAPDRLALIPRPNALQLIRETEQMRVHHAAAVVIQKLVRGVRARGGVQRIRYWALRRFVVSKVQAIVRGYQTRKRLRLERERRDQARSALLLQRCYRGHKGRERSRAQRRLRALRADQSVAALRIQAAFRGWRGRKVAARVRRDKALEALRAVERRNREEQMALRIQRTFRGRKGYLAYLVLLETKRLEEERRFKDTMAALRLQAAWRRRMAYQELLRRRAAKLQRELEERTAVVLQRVYRGMLGRRIAAAEAKTQAWQREQASSVVIQRAWRGCRGRHVAALMKSLATLLNHEREAACKIQTFWRSCQAVALYEFLKLVQSEARRKEQAALQIQRVFRGHKGREEREVIIEFRKYEAELAPLRNLAARFAAEVEVGQAKLDEVLKRQTKMKSQVEDLELELDEVSKHRSKWYDSANVTGTLQRYRTGYLAQALRGQIEVLRARLQALQFQDIDPMRIEVRALEKQHRDVVRQLAPREAGLSFEIRRSRPARLRAKLKLREDCACSIQAAFRTYRVKSATAMGGGHWQEAHDEESGSTYYFNVFTQETTYQAPWSFRVLRDDAARQANNTLAKLYRLIDTAKTTVTWQQFFDETTGYPFWYNAQTNEYRWEAPTEYTAMERQLSYDTSALDNVDVSQSARLRETGSEWVWVEYQDDEGRIYYYNAVTQQAQWEKPQGFDEQWLKDQDAQALTARSSRVRTARASDWAELRDEHGNLYYWNERTGETQWDKPADFDAQWLEDEKDALTARSIRSSKELGSEWQELLDPETGYTYYYNIVTQETAWSLPPSLLQAENESSDKEGHDQANNANAVEYEETQGGDGEANVDTETWVPYYEEDGSVNYYDPNTAEALVGDGVGDTVALEGAPDVTSAISLSQATEGSPWQELMDVETGTTYLWNSETGETAHSWEEVVQEYKDAGLLSDVRPEDLYMEAEIAQRNADPMTFTSAQRIWDIYGANVAQDPQLLEHVEALLAIEAQDTDEALSQDAEHVELMQWLAQYVMDGQLMSATAMAKQALDRLRYDPTAGEGDIW
ncbi:F-box/LRR-repeat protein 2 [Hondaea fermentalgiana]|uniref:F-box/LRR-repeat protein 2 n=1 Tax=Hondaea fermentalgiana TaxID=2315210 RepID=A0A2R5GKS2_9STRA|nr:F-box/LRR-repeat protein 2 [Hondaea fermentalgiana]|eukprot:GBG30328.1 F-box/LRR-repeat protein 2 [Hondaea fermentalgiana]